MLALHIRLARRSDEEHACKKIKGRATCRHHDCSSRQFSSSKDRKTGNEGRQGSYETAHHECGDSQEGEQNDEEGCDGEEKPEATFESKECLSEGIKGDGELGQGLDATITANVARRNEVRVPPGAVPRPQRNASAFMRHLLLLAVFFPGCITEPAPDEPKVHGHVGSAMKQKKPSAKAQPIVTEVR
jgi:hypothetical protein